MVFGANQPFPPSVGSFQVPVEAPDSDPDDGDQVTICFAEAWLPFVLGALQQLTLQATWSGDEATVLLAQSRAMLLLSMVGSADGGCTGSTCISRVRYNIDIDIIEQTIDGGTTWFPNPGADPRHATPFRYPVVDAIDPRCQAASNMSRYINDLLDQVILVVDAAGDGEGILAIIMAAFVELGPFGVLVDVGLALAFVLFSAGATALSTAFTNTVYDTLVCIFFCNVDATGQVSPGSLENINSQIDDQIGGLAAIVLHGMFLFMGEVGLSNAGVIGGALSADCDGCSGCAWCVTEDLNAAAFGWEPRVVTNSPCNDWGGTWISGQGFVNLDAVSISIRLQVAAGTHLTRLAFHTDNTSGRSPAVIANVNADLSGTNIFRVNDYDSGAIDFTFAADTYLFLVLGAPTGTTCADRGSVNIDSVTVEGEGLKPDVLPDSNC